MRRTLASALVSGLLAAGCASDASGGEPDPPSAPDAVILSRDIAFDRDEVRIAAGVEVTLVHDHRDGSIPHNLHVEGVEGEPRTEVVPGPVRQRLTFTVDEPGDYRFVCDVHPNMRGTLIVG